MLTSLFLILVLIVFFKIQILNYKVVDKDHGNILTRYLGVVENRKLLKLICKGPKSREENPITLQ